MEQKQEKKTTTTLSKPTASFPLDLTADILLKLPAKSIARFRCVSKLWSSIITDPYFTKSFETRSSTRPSILLGFQEGDKMILSSIPTDHHSSNESHTPIKSIHHCRVKLPQCGHFYPTESVHVLICFQYSGNPIVWNPSTGQSLTLPKPEPEESRWKNGLTLFLGYDPVEGKHKVLYKPLNQTYDECLVLTLGSAQKSWRTVKTNDKHGISDRYGCCISGFIYYKAFISDHDNLFLVIMSFDVRTEKLDLIKLPSDMNIRRCWLISYKGRLACIVEHGGFKFLVLEDAKKHKWLMMEDFCAPLLHHYPSSTIISQLKGMTLNGEYVYVPKGVCESFYVVFYDLEKNSFRRVEVEGM